MKKVRIFNPQNRFRNFMLVAILVSAMLMVDDLITGIGDAFSYSFLSSGILFLIGLIILDKRGYHSAAKLGSVLVFNIIFFALTYYFGIRSLSLIFYFPFLIIFIYMFKESGTRSEAAVLFGTCLVFLVAAFVLCSMDGHAELTKSDLNAMFIKNFIIGVALAGYYIYEIFAYQIAQNKTLQHQKDLAEEASKSKARFLSIISHELRTPLNGIIGTLNLMTTTDNEADKIRYQKILESSSKHLLHLVNNVLDYSKASAGRIQLSAVSFRIDEMLTDLHSIFQSRFAEKNIRFNLSVDPALSVRVVADDIRFTQVVTNLLSNALKYTETGSVNVNAIARSINESKLDLLISVADTGRGVAEDQHKKIFDSFNNISNKSRNVESTGLGLSIAKMILDLMGGAISLTSTPGKGSTFSINCSFPLDEKQVERVSDERNQLELFSLHKKKILVAEDNEINMLVIREFLKRWDIDTLEAVDGTEAIEIFSQTNDIDLALLDLQMPRTDGYQVMEWLKANRPDLPTIAFTASLMDGEDKSNLIQIGFHDVVAKPFSPADLEVKLKQAIAKTNTHSSFAA